MKNIRCEMKFMDKLINYQKPAEARLFALLLLLAVASSMLLHISNVGAQWQQPKLATLFS